jgi:hypothetical protein
MDVVYIPTLSRPDNIAKIVPYWLEQDIQVRLVVERNEYGMHNALKRREGWGREVYILTLPAQRRGVGYARNYCMVHASRTALTSIIMSDDDVYVKPTSDASLLLREAEKPGVLGIGGTMSIHDRFTNGATSRLHGPILCPGGWGFKLYGLNIQATLDCGNYDKRLIMHAEQELARQGISHGTPWLVHCDVKCNVIGKRYAPGGLTAIYSTREQLDEADRACMAIIHKAWPEFTNSPDKPSRVSWIKMLDRYIPGWEDRSAIHGGSLLWDAGEFQ